MSANPPAATAVDPIASALSFLGPWGALAALALKFGVPFVSKIFENAKNSVDPTPAEWDSVVNLIAIPGEVLIPKKVGP